MRKAVKRCRKYLLHVILFILFLILLFVIISEKASENNTPAKHESAAGQVSITIIENNETGSAIAGGSGK